MSVKGIPLSRAEIAVHFPVPFCPAASLIFSTRGVPSVSYKHSLSLMLLSSQDTHLISHDVSCNFNKERIKFSFVPFRKYLTINSYSFEQSKERTYWCHVVMTKTQPILHKIIGLTDKLKKYTSFSLYNYIFHVFVNTLPVIVKQDNWKLQHVYCTCSS